MCLRLLLRPLRDQLLRVVLLLLMRDEEKEKEEEEEKKKKKMLSRWISHNTKREFYNYNEHTILHSLYIVYK